MNQKQKRSNYTESQKFMNNQKDFIVNRTQSKILNTNVKCVFSMTTIRYTTYKILFKINEIDL